MKRFLRWLPWLMVVFAVLMTQPGPSRAQDAPSDLIEVRIQSAGFGGLYRAGYWAPLRVEVINRGDDFDGRLVVRPATSIDAVDHTFSAPVDGLSRPIAPASQSSRSLTLYVLPRGGDAELRVELLNAAGDVVASEDTLLRDIDSRDLLAVTVPRDNPLDLSGVDIGGFSAFQVGWELADIPTRSGGLDAIDLMVFSDVNTARLSDAQQDALRAWVLGGGHLIATGGDNNAETAAGLGDLLPFTPAPGQGDTIDSLTPLARFSGNYRRSLNAETFITVGDVAEDRGAVVLVETQDGLPLVVRRSYGAGTVDYLTVSPGLEPLASYTRMDDLFFNLMTTTPARPNWTDGFFDWDDARTAVEILPGIDLLPAVLSLMGFLLLYIMLIGPINFIVLSRLNRRGYAWLTIPALIAVFTALAWSVGFQLRGSEVTLSRLAVIQTWPESDEARVDQLVGLLAPRRGDYTLELAEPERMLRPAARGDALNPLSLERENIRIDQGSRFSAVEFPVDASFIATFSTQTTIPRPEINGSATLQINAAGEMTLRGVVRNESNLTLSDPVILAPGIVLPLAQDLTPDGPGNLIDFSSDPATVVQDDPAAPHPLEFDRGTRRVSVVGSSSGSLGRSPAVSNVDSIMLPFLGEDGIGALDDEGRRRQLLLRAFINDTYGSTGRGDRVYLVGWADEAPLAETVPGEQVRRVETTLVIVALETTLTGTPGGDTLLTSDQFTWVALSRGDLGDVGPVGMELMGDNSVSFRFTPVPGAVLEDVEALRLVLERGSVRVGGVIDLWDWQADEWVQVQYSQGERYTVEDHERFIGPMNAVQVRTVPRDEGGIRLIASIGIEQVGRLP